MKLNLKNVFLSVGIFAFTLALVGALSTNKAEAATKTAASGDWNTAGTWTPSGIPSGTDDAVIPVGVTVTATSGLTIGAGVSGTLINHGTLTITGGDLTISTGATATNDGTIDVSGKLTGAGGFTNDTNGTLNVGGTVDITTLTSTAAGNTVNYNGAAQTCKATTYKNLTFSGTDVKTCASTSVTGNLVTSGTVSWTQTAAMTIGGNLTVGGTSSITTGGAAFTVTSGTTTINGGTLTLTNDTGAKTFGGLITVNTGTLNGASTNIVTSAGIANVGGTVSITGTDTIGTAGATFSGTNAIANLTISTGTTTNSGTLTISGTLTVNGAMANSGILTVTTALSGSNALTNTGTLNISGTSGITTLTAGTAGTVNYNTGAQDIKYLNTATPVAYYNLGLSGSGLKTIGGAITVNNDTVVDSATTVALTGASTTYGLKLGGTWKTMGTWGATGATNVTMINDSYFKGSGAGTITNTTAHSSSTITTTTPVFTTGGGSTSTSTTPVLTPETATTPAPETTVTPETPTVSEALCPNGKTLASNCIVAPATSTSTMTVLKFTKSLNTKSSMADVKNLQEALNKVGGASLVVDGKWGKLTTAAVKRFQKANGLAQVGTVGPQTRAKLNTLLGL